MIGRDRNHGNKCLDADLLGEVTGIAIERNNRENVILIDTIHQIAGCLAPLRVARNGNQRHMSRSFPGLYSLQSLWRFHELIRTCTKDGDRCRRTA